MASCHLSIFFFPFLRRDSLVISNGRKNGSKLVQFGINFYFIRCCCCCCCFGKQAGHLVSIIFPVPVVLFVFHYVVPSRHYSVRSDIRRANACTRL